MQYVILMWLLLLLLSTILTTTGNVQSEDNKYETLNPCPIGSTPSYSTSFFLQRDLKCSPTQGFDQFATYFYMESNVLYSVGTNTVFIFDSTMTTVLWKYTDTITVDKFASSYSADNKFTIGYQSGNTSIIRSYDLKRRGLATTRTNSNYHRFAFLRSDNGFVYVVAVVKKSEAQGEVNLNFDTCDQTIPVTVTDEYSMFVMEISMTTLCSTMRYAFLHSTSHDMNFKFLVDYSGLTIAYVDQVTQEASVEHYLFQDLFSELTPAIPKWRDSFPANLGRIVLASVSAKVLNVLMIGRSTIKVYKQLNGEQMEWKHDIPDDFVRRNSFLFAYYTGHLNDSRGEYTMGYVQKIAGSTELWKKGFSVPHTLSSNLIHFGVSQDYKYHMLHCDSEGSVFYHLITRACNKCPPGTRGITSKLNSGSFCEECRPGTYSYKGSKTCEECPRGTFNQYIASSRLSDCIPCLPGSYNNDTGSSKCSLCQNNHYSLVGASTCIPCPYATHTKANSDPTDLTSCVPCPAGTVHVDGTCQNCTKQGTICPLGTFYPIDQAVVETVEPHTHYYDPSEEQFKIQKEYQDRKYYIIIPACGMLFLVNLTLVLIWVLCGGGVKDFDFIFPKFNYVQSGEFYMKKATAKGAIFTGVAISVALAAVLLSFYEYLYANVLHNVVLTQLPVDYPKGEYQIKIRLYGAEKNIGLGSADWKASGFLVSETTEMLMSVEGSDIELTWKCTDCVLGKLSSKVEVTYKQPALSAIAIGTVVIAPWTHKDQPFYLYSERLVASTEGELVFRGTKPHIIYLTSSPSVYIDGSQQSTGAYLMFSAAERGSTVDATQFSQQESEIQVHVVIDSSPNTLLTTKVYKQSFLNVLAQCFSLVATVVAVMGFVLVRIDMVVKGVKLLMRRRRAKRMKWSDVISEPQRMNTSIN